MKKTVLAAMLAGLMVAPAFAAEKMSGQKGEGQTVEQKKAEIIAHIDQRISLSQQERTCVQAATTHDGIKACREKFRPTQQKGDSGSQGDRQSRDNRNQNQ